MEIREVVPQDFAEASALHKSMGFDYQFDPADQGFAIRNGLFNGTGQLVTAVFGRLTVEAYLLVDRRWRTPSDRWEAMQRLAAVSTASAHLLGAVETHAFVPPELERQFKKRLFQMGWSKALWPAYFKEL